MVYQEKIIAWVIRYFKDKSQYFFIEGSKAVQNASFEMYLNLRLTLNIFMSHGLRKKFLQLILISLDSASWEL